MEDKSRHNIKLPMSSKRGIVCWFFKGAILDFEATKLTQMSPLRLTNLR